MAEVKEPKREHIIYYWIADGSIIYGFKFKSCKYAVAGKPNNPVPAFEGCLYSFKILDLYGQKYLDKNKEIDTVKFSKEIIKNKDKAVYNKFNNHKVNYKLVNKELKD